MVVIMKGGTTGNSVKYGLPPVPDSGEPQPVIDTSTDGPVPSSIHLNAEGQRPHRHGQEATATFMPTGVTDEAGGTDISDPGATTGGDESVFKGAPNTGVKGGPA